MVFLLFLLSLDYLFKLNGMLVRGGISDEAY
jgi:hypothetical protein